MFALTCDKPILFSGLSIKFGYNSTTNCNFLLFDKDRLQVATYNSLDCSIGYFIRPRIQFALWST